ncbi:MAG: thioredoxin family protein [Myxococcales bacterium]|nr:thioredoxin family protein [Myxococcales bacterium]
MNRLALAALALALAACQRDAPPPAETATTTKAAEAQKPAEAPEPPEAPKATPKTPRAERKAAAALKWPDGVEWADDWAAARARSAESGKPICLVVYADWCPRCKELTPVFADPEIVEASKGLVMVRQDNDARPDWLMAYADQGTYVPRIFFFGADGNLRTDLTSGHPRYPFFYTPTGKSALLRSMRAAAGG